MEDVRSVMEVLFVDVTVSGPGPVAVLIVDAALSEGPRMAYPCGFMSQEMLDKGFQLDDEEFNRFMGELTGLGALKA